MTHSTDCALTHIKHPLIRALSDFRARSKQGRTSIGQAASLNAKLCSKDKGYIFFLHIAKAYPHTPHLAVSIALEAMGARGKLFWIIEVIIRHNTHSYDDFHYLLSRGIKENCPLSPSLFVLMYEAYHVTLARDFPSVDFAPYVDHLAMIAGDTWTLLRVLRSVSQLPHPSGLLSKPTQNRDLRVVTKAQ